MLYDLNRGTIGQALTKKRFDVCVAGAGVAGITLALKLAKFGKSVLLLEGGGQEISSESQDLYQGKNIGLEYFYLDAARLRYLGGTSNHWAGWCRPLDASDFEVKDYIPYSGWPIKKADIEHYEDEAYDILDITTRRARPDVAFTQSAGMLNWFEFSYSSPTRFNQKYYEILKRSSKIHLVLNANVVDFKTDDSRRRIVNVVCRSHANLGRDRLFSAERFILSLGGIENARTLLNANAQMPNGIGNQNDLVGRFFTEHPHFELGIYWQNKPQSKRLFLTPTAKLINREKIANCGLRLMGYHDFPVLHFDVGSAKNIAKNLACDVEIVHKLFKSIGYDVHCSTSFARLQAAWEQTPNPDSRVLLSDKRDIFGLRTVELDWRWTPMERRTALVCAMECGKAFARGNTGRLKIADWLLDEKLPVPGYGNGNEVAGNHHMGTTRMSDSPHSGVVDSNCRVFGLDNFYVAGSSIFSTGGHANPTFTIVQLALRLADHIKNFN